MAEKKPRVFQGMSDMALSMAVIVVIMVISVGFTGLCSFNPGAPENGPVQEVDASNFIQQEQANSPFPVVLPEMPEGWVTNSARRSAFGESIAPTVGWVTPAGGYAQLMQTSASVDDILASYAAAYEETGSPTVGGVVAHHYAADGERDVYIADTGENRLVVTGSADEPELEELLAAAIEARK
ncbi:DUF4245 domain-containing protein [Corynebacterium glucuronolyticum]|uniref:DUF4245 domain-containing protein n=1 Tax=Corynebacterium glucuronolyticum TaxID=39791 RepID=UPI001F445273|nr:DUF4245 domain-containing protein [Corynebacterium glucuronolyticum]